MDDNNDLGSFLVGLIVGGLVGAAVALLYAPQSGEETRILIKDKSLEVRDKAAAAADDALTRAEATIEETRIRAEQLRDRGMNVLLGEQKARLETAINEASDTPEEAVE